MSTSPRYTIALTGALGLVGCGFTALALSLGHRVIALDIRPSDMDEQLLLGLGETTPQDIALRRAAIDAAEDGQYTYIQCDLTDYQRTKQILEKEGCDAVVHLAAVYAKKDAEGRYLSGPDQNVIHNLNTAMSYNMMLIAAELGIRRVVVASSVNSIGMVFSKHPRFDYLPLDESHPFYPEDAYSLSKYITEIQADSICRRYPSLRIASMRFHWVVPTPMQSRDFLHQRGGNPKDLWGFVSLAKAAEACLAAITLPLSDDPAPEGVHGISTAGTGWEGHETFFIVARTTCQQASSAALVRDRYPGVTDLRFTDAQGSEREMGGNEALICTDKAERLLGWKDEGYPWSG